VLITPNPTGTPPVAQIRYTDRNTITSRKHRGAGTRFNSFNQVRELTHNYGKMDILWLDGGWVRPLGL